MIRKENPNIDSQFLLKMLGPFKYAHTILNSNSDYQHSFI